MIKKWSPRIEQLQEDSVIGRDLSAIYPALMREARGDSQDIMIRTPVVLVRFVEPRKVGLFRKRDSAVQSTGDSIGRRFQVDGVRSRKPYK